MLTAWLRKSDSSESQPLVVVFPGNAGNRADRRTVGDALAATGASVVLAEYRGYGGNPGRPSEEGLVDDALATVDAAIAALGRRTAWSTSASPSAPRWRWARRSCGLRTRSSSVPRSHRSSTLRATTIRGSPSRRCSGIATRPSSESTVVHSPACRRSLLQERRTARCRSPEQRLPQQQAHKHGRSGGGRPQRCLDSLGSGGDRRRQSVRRTGSRCVASVPTGSRPEDLLEPPEGRVLSHIHLAS